MSEKCMGHPTVVVIIIRAEEYMGYVCVFEYRIGAWAHDFSCQRENENLFCIATPNVFFFILNSVKNYLFRKKMITSTHTLSLSFSPPDSFCLYLNHSLKSFRFSRSYQFPWISVENLVKMHLILIVLFSHRSANDVKNCILYHFDRTDSMRNI